MKTWKLMGLGSIAGLLAGFAGSQAGDFIMAKRFMVAHTPEKTSAVLMSESDGAGRLVIYDAAGEEAFAVKGGDITSKAFDDLLARLDRLEAAAAAMPAESPPITVAAPLAPPPASPSLTVKWMREGDEVSNFNGLDAYKVRVKVRNDGDALLRAAIVIDLVDRDGDLVCRETHCFNDHFDNQMPLQFTLVPGRHEVVTLMVEEEKYLRVADLVWHLDSSP